MSRIILTGFMATGKSQVGPLVARQLGWTFVDTDALIEQAAGKSVHEIFDKDSEPRFRELECQALRDACARKNAVIATGGGAVIAPASRELMLRSGFVVCLEASAETVLRRTEEQARSGQPSVRPLLQGGSVLEKIKLLKETRQRFYAEAHWTVHTDRLTVEQVADEVVRAYRLMDHHDTASTTKPREHERAGPKSSPRPLGEGTGEGTNPHFPDAAYVVTTPTATCPGYIGWGILDRLGQRMREAGLSGAAYVIADRPVFTAYGKRVMASLKQAGFAVDHHFLAPGEPTKTLVTAEQLYAWLAQRKAERGHVIVALGGGMAGDLAGFVAATYLRGMPFVQVPTTLLAMVDASIGGKVAVNLPAGKNLVGAFHQPRLVLADVETLKTLPARELTSGWAEVIKHGLILDADLFHHIEQNAAKLCALEPGAATEVIQRSARIKAQVVSADERESGDGPRTLLNYGHTVGHALEAATDYQGLLHGEAVGIGMTAAAEIAVGMGILSAGEARQQREALAAFGLPLKVDPQSEYRVDLGAVRAAMGLDKKVTGGRNRWVLLERIGKAVVRGDVPQAVVETALHNVLTA